MSWFQRDHRDRGPQSRKIYAAFEIAYTAVDFCAAFAFLIGSIFFLWEDLMRTATWLFIVGSILFALKPTLRLAREIKFASEGDYEDLAEREKG